MSFFPFSLSTFLIPSSFTVKKKKKKKKKKGEKGNNKSQDSRPSLSLSPWLKTSHAGSTFPNLCGDSTSATSSAEEEEEEPGAAAGDGGSGTSGGSILSQKSAAATWSASKTATRSLGPISLPAG